MVLYPIILCLKKIEILPYVQEYNVNLLNSWRFPKNYYTSKQMPNYLLAAARDFSGIMKKTLRIKISEKKQSEFLFLFYFF